MKLTIETTRGVEPKQKIVLDMEGGSPYYSNILINGKMYSVFVKQPEYEGGEDEINIEETK